MLALPLATKKKALQFLSGLAMITLFIMLKQWIHILYTYCKNPFLELYSFSSFQKRMIEFGYENLIKTPGPTLFIVLLIWFSISFRSGGVRQLLNFENGEGK
jgi:hypothetical protein